MTRHCCCDAVRALGTRQPYLPEHELALLRFVRACLRRPQLGALFRLWSEREGRPGDREQEAELQQAFRQHLLEQSRATKLWVQFGDACLTLHRALERTFHQFLNHLLDRSVRRRLYRKTIRALNRIGGWHAPQSQLIGLVGTDEHAAPAGREELERLRLPAGPSKTSGQLADPDGPRVLPFEEHLEVLLTSLGRPVRLSELLEHLFEHYRCYLEDLRPVLQASRSADEEEPLWAKLPAPLGGRPIMPLRLLQDEVEPQLTRNLERQAWRLLLESGFLLPVAELADRLGVRKTLAYELRDRIFQLVHAQLTELARNDDVH